MRKTEKKRLKHVLILTPVALVLLLAVVALGAWCKFGTFVVAARSIYKLQDGLYVMEYRGDYGFDEFLAQGGAADDSAVADYLIGFLSGGFYKKADNEIKPGDFGCTTVCVKDQNGAVYFGRNFDWKKDRAIIVHTVPENGYESLSTCDLDFLGFGDDYSPDGSMQERIQTLAAIYVPLDGMNEKGLVIADLMAGDDEETHQKTDKPDLTTTTAIRLLLDRAANVGCGNEHRHEPLSRRQPEEGRRGRGVPCAIRPRVRIHRPGFRSRWRVRRSWQLDRPTTVPGSPVLYCARSAVAKKVLVSAGGRRRRCRDPVEHRVRTGETVGRLLFPGRRLPSRPPAFPPPRAG